MLLNFLIQKVIYMFLQFPNYFEFSVILGIFFKDLLCILIFLNFFCIYQGLSKYQDVSSTPITKVTKLIVFFWTSLVQ